MAVLGKDTKQPNEVGDWDVDFADWLPQGDAIDWVDTDVRLLSGDSATPLVVDNVQNTLTTSKVWLSGGAHGSRYRVELRATTLGGRIKEAEFDINVKEV